MLYELHAKQQSKNDDGDVDKELIPNVLPDC
jgi:hypothetical protein